MDIKRRGKNPETKEINTESYSPRDFDRQTYLVARDDKCYAKVVKFRFKNTFYNRNVFIGHLSLCLFPNNYCSRPISKIKNLSLATR